MHQNRNSTKILKPWHRREWSEGWRAMSFRAANRKMRHRYRVACSMDYSVERIIVSGM